MRDLRLACRALAATPVVTFVAILSLALGIGANVAIFSLANSLLLRSLPVTDPDRLVAISDTSERGLQYWPLPVWDEIRHRPELFEATFAWTSARLALTDPGHTRPLTAAWVSGSTFAALGVHAQVGRVLAASDDTASNHDGPIAVVSDSFWRRELAGDPAVVGRPISLNGVMTTVVGVTARDFFGIDIGSSIDAMLPLNDEPLIQGRDSAVTAGRMNAAVFARLKPGQTRQLAIEALRAIQPQIREATRPLRAGGPGDDPYGREYLKAPFVLQPAGSGTSLIRSRYAQPLLVLLGIASLVLLAACANVANVLLARAGARRHELSVRVALGASRYRLVRQLFTESVLLSVASAVAGVLTASWASRLLVNQLSIETGRIVLDLSVDWRTAAFASGVAIASVVICGVLPALRASGIAPIEALKQHGQPAREGGGRTADLLVVAQVALSIVLVVAAGLFVRTFTSLATRDLGFARESILLARIDSQRAVADLERRMAVYERVREIVAAQPNVAEAALSVITPVSNMVMDPPVSVSGTNVASTRVYSNAVSAHWLEVYGIPVVAGRGLLDTDGLGTTPVAVVNKAFARRFFGASSPIDQFITLPELMVRPSPNVPLRIVGVVADAVYVRLRELPQPTMYMPMVQHSNPFFAGSYSAVNLNIRARAGSPSQLARGVAAAIASVNPRLEVTFRSLSDQISDALARERVLALLAGFFGVLAMLLAALGLYGVTTYAVIRRRGEIAIRMALGATPSGIMRMVLSHAGGLVAVGMGVGWILSLWGSRAIASLLYGVAPRDGWTFIGAALVLGVVSAIAGWLPAWRASRADPALVLRQR